MTDDPKRPILRAPLKNFKFIGEFTEADSEWWKNHCKAWAVYQGSNKKTGDTNV